MFRYIVLYQTSNLPTRRWYIQAKSEAYPPCRTAGTAQRRRPHPRSGHSIQCSSATADLELAERLHWPQLQFRSRTARSPERKETMASWEYRHWSEALAAHPANQYSISPRSTAAVRPPYPLLRQTV